MPDHHLIAQRIEAVYSAHGIPARVWQAAQMPGFTRYVVTPALGTSLRKIVNLDEELALALDAPAVRVIRHRGTLHVEVPRPDPQRVTLAMIMPKVPRYEAVAALGIDEFGVPLLLRLPSPRVAHVLISGTTGSGKTELLRTMLVSLALRNRVGRLHIAIVDPKGRFADLGQLPHLVALATEPVLMRDVLRQVVALIERRGAAYILPRLILAVDELADVVGYVRDALEMIERITQRGRESGVHLLAATQRPSALLIGGNMRANLPTRLVGRVVSPEEAKIASGLAQTGAEQLNGNGDFLLVAGGDTLRFQAALTTATDLAALPIGGPMARRWTFAGLQPEGEAEPVPAGEDYTAIGVLPRRPTGPTAQDRQRIRAAYQALGSANKVIVWAYGAKSALTLSWVRNALDEGDAEP